MSAAAQAKGLEALIAFGIPCSWSNWIRGRGLNAFNWPLSAESARHGRALDYTGGIRRYLLHVTPLRYILAKKVRL